jgi:hypothetical protein
MNAPPPGSLNAMKDEEKRKLDFIWKRASMEPRRGGSGGFTGSSERLHAVGLM